MKAAYIERFGGPEALMYGERPVPEPGPDGARIRVHACGVCRHDMLTRAGAFPAAGLPVILGHQIAGVVDSVGPLVKRLAPGDRVMSMVFETCDRCDECLRGNQTLCQERPRFLGEDLDGGYAEFVVARENVWLPLPDGLSMQQGALVTCTAGTAFHAVVGRALARPGETALVTGATGGVGRQALGILAATGVRTIAVTRRAEQEEQLRAAGADHVVVGAEYRREVKRLTDRGADFAIDIVGGEGLLETLHSVRPGGRVVVTGNVEGGEVMLKPALLILKEVSLIGTKSITRAELTLLLDLLGRGVMRIEPGAVWPLEKAAEVHTRMTDGSLDRRVVLDPRNATTGM